MKLSGKKNIKISSVMSWIDWSLFTGSYETQQNSPIIWKNNSREFILKNHLNAVLEQLEDT